MSMEQDAPEINLAVDFIYILETGGIDPHTALAALKLVERDLLKKIEQGKQLKSE